MDKFGGGGKVGGFGSHCAMAPSGEGIGGVTMLKNQWGGACGDKFIKGSSTGNVPMNELGDRVEDDSEFTQIGGGGRKHHIIRIDMVGRVCGDFKRKSSECRTALVITEQNRIKDRIEGLVKLGVHVVSGVGFLGVRGDTDEVGNDTLVCRSCNIVQNLRVNLIEDLVAS